MGGTRFNKHFDKFTHVVSEEGENSTVCGLDLVVNPTLMLTDRIEKEGMCGSCKRHMALHSGGNTNDYEAFAMWFEAMKDIDVVSARTAERQKDIGMMSLLPPYEREWWLLENLSEPQGLNPDILKEADVQEARARVDVDEVMHYIYMRSGNDDVSYMNQYEVTRIPESSKYNSNTPRALKKYRGIDIELLYIKSDLEVPAEKFLTFNGEPDRSLKVEKLVIRGSKCTVTFSTPISQSTFELEIPFSAVFSNVPRWEWLEYEAARHGVVDGDSTSLSQPLAEILLEGRT